MRRVLRAILPIIENAAIPPKTVFSVVCSLFSLADGDEFGAEISHVVFSATFVAPHVRKFKWTLRYRSSNWDL